jgi:hypothetical protein
VCGRPYYIRLIPPHSQGFGHIIIFEVCTDENLY